MTFDYEGWDRVAREKGDAEFLAVLTETFGRDFPIEEAKRILNEPKLSEVAQYAPRFNGAVRARLR